MSIILNKAKTHIEVKQKNGETLTQVETDLLNLINLDQLSSSEKLDLIESLKNLTLLSDGKVNPKTAKTIAGFEFNNYILHLTPADLSGVNICPAASKGCKAACLNAAGRGRFDSIQFARLRKTLYYTKLRIFFLNHLDREIQHIVRKNTKKDVNTAIRLNGTSDIPWESLKVRDGLSLIELHQGVTFYDYTKIFNRLHRLNLSGLSNYNLTFSASESNQEQVVKALGLGFNVATVFDHVPSEYLNRPVLDGDLHDFRFLDKKSDQGYIIGLKAKGPAKKDLSGFVRRMNIEIKNVG
jgi:hypothetical protein